MYIFRERRIQRGNEERSKGEMHDMRGDTEEKRKEERRRYTRRSEACRDERRDTIHIEEGKQETRAGERGRV